MKRWIVITLVLSLALAGCARLRGKAAQSPAAPTAAESNPAADTSQMGPVANPTPDFEAMTFSEKNKLYLDLLEEKQNAGVDTSQAEDAYLNSLEASMKGESQQADEYLQDAILLLWDQ